jgi:hypothetical protein
LLRGVASLRSQRDAAQENGVAFFSFEYSQPGAESVNGFIELFGGVGLHV